MFWIPPHFKIKKTNLITLNLILQSQIWSRYFYFQIVFSDEKYSVKKDLTIVELRHKKSVT